MLFFIATEYIHLARMYFPACHQITLFQVQGFPQIWVMRHLQPIRADSPWTCANSRRISPVTSLFLTIIPQPCKDHFNAFDLVNILYINKIFILPVLRQGLHTLNRFKLNYSIEIKLFIRFSVKGF